MKILYKRPDGRDDVLILEEPVSMRITDGCLILNKKGKTYAFSRGSDWVVL